MTLITIELVLILILGALLVNVLKSAKNEYAEGGRFQIIVNRFAITKDFASIAEARAFAHAIAMEKTKEGERVRIFKVFAIDANKAVAPIGVQKAFKEGEKEYNKGYNRVTMATDGYLGCRKLGLVCDAVTYSYIMAKKMHECIDLYKK